MRIELKTEYVLYKDDGEMFDEAILKTEQVVNSKEGVTTIFEIHNEKIEKIQRRSRIHVDDYVNFIPDKEQFK